MTLKDFSEIKIDNILSFHRAEFEQLSSFMARHRTSRLFYNTHPDKITFVEKPELENFLRKQFSLFAEQINLSKLFAENNIPLLFLKGPSLSNFLYNDPTMRTSRDIDILMQPSALNKTHDILKNNGYKSEQDEKEIFKGKFLKYFHHISYWNHSKKIMVELHLRPFSMSDFWIERDITELSTFYSVSGIQLPVLKNEYLLNYLCIHGSLHKWGELIWVADLAQYLLKYARETNWQKVIEISKQQGTEKTLYLGLLLAHKIFEVKIPDEIIIPKNNSIIKLYNKVIAGYSFKGNIQKAEKWKKLIYFMQLKNSIKFKIRCIYFRFFRAII